MNALPSPDAAGHVSRALHEPIAITDYDPQWPRLFEAEKRYLERILPEGRIGRIEHFGSTAVVGLAAKPIIDMLVEVRSLLDVRDDLAPLLESLGYEYFWRPSAPGDDDIAYAWFIKRGRDGRRTHHIHMLAPESPEWNRLAFRDYLRTHPETAQAYAMLKRRVAAQCPDDRIAYARAKTQFIEHVNELAERAQAAQTPRRC